MLICQFYHNSDHLSVSALQKMDYYKMIFSISFDAELVLSTRDWMGVKLYKAAMWQNFTDNYIYKTEAGSTIR